MSIEFVMNCDVVCLCIVQTVEAVINLQTLLYSHRRRYHTTAIEFLREPSPSCTTVKAVWAACVLQLANRCQGLPPLDDGAGLPLHAAASTLGSGLLRRQPGFLPGARYDLGMV